MSADALLQFATAALQVPIETPEPMVGGGSDRRFFRLRAGARTWVGAVSNHVPETRAFLAFTAHFAAAGIPVPAIHAADAKRGLYVMEDLGPHTLSALLQRWRMEPDGRRRALDAVRAVVRWLAVIQVRGGAGLDYSLCYEGQELNRAGYEADVAHFLHQYVPRFVLQPGPEPAVRADLTRLVERLDAVPRQHFCYRDFQCRNVMWPVDSPVFIDYQSGRRGPLQYDLASLLYSPDTGLDDGERDALVADYLAALADVGVTVEREPFLRDFHAIVLIRRLQALGAYAHLAVGKGKPAYLGKIAPAIQTLQGLFARGRLNLGLPALEAWLRDALQAPTVH